MAEKKYDSSWDSDEDVSGEAFDKKYEEWEERDWIKWLKQNLTFPFQAERVEDMDADPLAPDESKKKTPFPEGCQVKVTGMSDCDCDVEFEGVIVDVIVDVIGIEGKKGALPLQELEVRPKSDPNYWPVREFVVWYANL